MALPPSIYMLRGKIVHSALEDFFKISISEIDKNCYEFELNVILQSLFSQKWKESEEELRSLNLTEQKLNFFHDESVSMLNNWFENFMGRLNKRSKNSELTLNQSFEDLKPETEIYFKSEEHMVQGYIDAIHKIDGTVSIIDYKTSRSSKITKEYELQLAIYAMFYQERHGVLPNYVGIDFVNDRVKYLEVDNAMVELAKKEARIIQENTASEDIEDYPSSNHPYCDCSKYQEVLEKTTLSKFIDQNV